MPLLQACMGYVFLHIFVQHNFAENWNLRAKNLLFFSALFVYIRFNFNSKESNTINSIILNPNLTIDYWVLWRIRINSWLYMDSLECKKYYN